MYRFPLRPSLAIAEPEASAAPAEQPVAVAIGWHVVAMAVVVGAAFFAIDHDLHTSLRESYASTEAEMEEMTEGGNSLRRVAFLSIAALGLIGLAASRDQRFPVGMIGLAMIAVVGWAAASYFWSIDDETTARRWLVLACAFVGVVGLGRMLPAREICLLGVVVGLGSLLVGLFAELSLGTFHPWTSDYRFAGTLHPNTQGMYLACLTIGAFCLARGESRGNAFYWTLVAVGLAALVLTKSRTSTAGVLLSLAAIWSLQASWQVRAAGIFAVASVLAVAIFAVLVSGVDLEAELQQAALLGRQEQSESLTGRIPIWYELSHFVGERPLTGYGYDTFWTADHIALVADHIEWPIKEAHNGYLDATLSVGLVGAGLMTLAVLGGLFAGASRFHESGDPATGIYVGMLVFGLINCCTESGMVMPQFPPFLAAIGLARLAFTESAADGRPA